MLGHAVEQLNATARLIRERHPALAEVPSDRPVVALIVTMEPFHVINSPFFTDWLPPTQLPISVCGVFELEHLVDVEGESIGRLLLDGLTDRDRLGWSVKGLLIGRPHRRNPLLGAAFATYPWKEAVEGGT
jgi:hypothetical protein